MKIITLLTLILVLGNCFAENNLTPKKKGCTANKGKACRVLVSQNSYLADLSKFQGPINVNACGKRNRDPNSLDFANCLCQIEGHAANHNKGTWRAWLSTENINALDNILPDKTIDKVYVRNSNTSIVIAESIEKLLSWELTHSISSDNERNIVWTGTDMYGQRINYFTCKGWTTTNREEAGEVGYSPSHLGGGWTALKFSLCAMNSIRLYCFETPKK